MRDEPAREVSRGKLKAILCVEPRAGSDGNGADRLIESDQTFDLRRADIFKDMRETSHRWQTSIKYRTELTNSIKGHAKRAAVERLLDTGLPMPKKGMPKATAADVAAIARAYPVLFAMLDVLNLRTVQVAEKKWLSPIEHDKWVMEKLAKMTPLMPWVRSVKGLGAAGLVHMLGMTLEPWDYPHYRMMVKMMGVAPRDTYPPSKKTGSPKVPKQRRALMLYCVVKPLLNTNDGKHREIYDAEIARLIELHPEMDRGINPKNGRQRVNKHAQNKALMKVASALIADFWQACRDYMPPPAEVEQQEQPSDQ